MTKIDLTKENRHRTPTKNKHFHYFNMGDTMTSLMVTLPTHEEETDHKHILVHGDGYVAFKSAGNPYHKHKKADN